MQRQQGDVMLETVDALPKGAKRVAAGRVVLAQGEATGHAHSITAEPEAVVLFEIRDSENPAIVERFLEVREPVALCHEEHATQTIERGVWRVDQVWEYDWTEQMERRVVD